MSSDLIPDDPILGQVTRSVVGFLREVRDDKGRRLFTPCGSGVLIEVGGIRGVLTAAHVIRELSKGGGTAALFTIAKLNEKAPRLEFQLNECQPVVVGGEGKDPHGPDLGFLRLPHHIEQRLINENVFYNFDVRLRGAKAKEPEEDLIHEVIVGVLGERLELKEITETTRVDTHTMIHAYSDARDFREGTMEGFDLFNVAIIHNDNVPSPENSYGGLSGAGVWKIGEKPGVNNRLLMGIAFYETDADSNGVRQIICHGPECIYRGIIEEIAKIFPDFSPQ